MPRSPAATKPERARADPRSPRWYSGRSRHAEFFARRDQRVIRGDRQRLAAQVALEFRALMLCQKRELVLRFDPSAITGTFKLFPRLMMALTIAAPLSVMPI